VKARRRRSQGGFTMIELLIALLVTSLLVVMVLSIFSRMSVAYREQQQIANVQQVLAGARSMIERDAKQAGLAMSDGFGIASDTLLHSPVQITNSSTGPDQIAFFYADPNVQAAVVSGATANSATFVNVDSSVGFATGMLVVVATPNLNAYTGTTTGDATITGFTSCVLQVATVGNGAPNSLTFSTAAPWGNATETQCTVVPGPNSTMVYKLAARAYRIDPARVGEGVLQVSPTGALQANTADWQDLGYGFTDIQVATYFYEKNDAVDTADPDTDPQRDWYSSTQQQTYTAPALAVIAPLTTFPPPLQMSISLVARTDRDVEGVPSSFTPTLTVAANTTSNQLGDHAAVNLATTVDPTLTGNRIFRYATFRVDFRNLGVGR
jgi:prepilin-type N-terminal cleavage/methylation domain-containing protein